jgi:hypothetical protein
VRRAASELPFAAAHFRRAQIVPACAETRDRCRRAQCVLARAETPAHC